MSCSAVGPQHLAQGLVFIISFSKYFLSHTWVLGTSTVDNVWSGKPVKEVSEKQGDP